jgi:hypothetical protein
MTTNNRNVFICVFSPRPNENGILASEYFFRGNFDLLSVHPEIYVSLVAYGDSYAFHQFRYSQMLNFISSAVINLVDSTHMLLYYFVLLMRKVC